ncbi:MAG TPA: methylmalonyl Co-A mutase-associated GTPase MeaB [Bacteroidales bacterium]|nr:methylmalonyl Co-A mutase-associated GTPase MeaB [Bacteroidales bacterium]HPI31007.1 methylmalonyl Co-A mutase-associated GTPase MeaB [Bacteroidales bacterium]
MNTRSDKSALRVQDGIEQPSSINEAAIKNIRSKKPAALTKKQLVEGVLSGNITLLSKAITLIESTLQEHQLMAQQVLEACLPYSGNSLRIGFTGVPGVGKSTLIEALGKFLTKRRHKLAVLAIDPSSYRTKGSILGDKTRMEELAADPNAFIRPSPSAGTLGGVARKTWETIILCEAAGFNIIFVETVGVGQSEVLVHSMVDFFLLLMLAGAGDELQGIKRGIMEMADAIVINKADGDNIARADIARMEYQKALHLFPTSLSGWEPKVTTCSARENKGIKELWKIIEEYQSYNKNNGCFFGKRTEQSLARMHYAIKEQLFTDFYKNKKIETKLKHIESKIANNTVSSYIAARELLELYYHSMNNPD